MHAVKLTAMEADKGILCESMALAAMERSVKLPWGAAGRKNTEVGIFPCGSGNDYIKILLYCSCGREPMTWQPFVKKLLNPDF